MKRLISLLVSLLLLAACVSHAQEAVPVQVYVSVTDENAGIALACAPVDVTDADENGVLSIADALACAHAQYHPLGASAFVCAETEYGISLLTLWNIDNGGSFGYCLNDASAMSLADPVEAGDHVKAYAYTDLDAWSDAYAYFSETQVTCVENTALSLLLNANGYDAAWAPVTYPVSGAVITVNGEKTETVTAEDGSFELSFAQAGEYLVSAYSDSMVLVSPVLCVTVTAE